MTILVLSAFISETKLLVKKYRSIEIASDRSFHLYQSDIQNVTIRFGTTGEGKESVRRFFEWYSAKAGAHDHPELVVSTGYAGALRKNLKAGDVVIADSVTDIETGRNFRLEIPEVLKNKYPHCLSSGLSVGRLTEGAAKAVLSSERPDAAFVDMESSAVMDYCGLRRLPCWIVRSISDPFGFRFPDLEFIRDKWTDIPRLRWVLRAFTDPADFFRALRLQWNLYKARRSIASAVSLALRDLISG